MDLNLLLVFDAIMAERHVTRAADKIGMSQPAMSNALNRLRHHLKDELFVRGPEGMHPTPRAVQLAEPVRRALSGIEAALEPPAFDPAATHWAFAVGANDFVAAILMPALAQYLSSHAPYIDIRLVPSAGQTFELLDAQRIDFGISAFSTIPERFESLLLMEDSYVVIMRRDHPLAKKKFTLQRFANASHLLVSPKGDAHGFIDRYLQEHGLDRRIAMVVNQFSVAIPILAQSNMIVTLPKRMADLYAPLHDLRVIPYPYPTPREFSVATLVWHKRVSKHPAYMWFCDTMRHISLGT